MLALAAVVFDRSYAPTPSWRALRTARVLAQRGVDSVHVSGLERLSVTLENSKQPTWIVCAGAVPIAAPRRPPPSATGRWLLAFGAVRGDAEWSSRLAETGGDGLGPRQGLPPVRSVYVERPAAFAEALAKDAADPVSSACWRLSGAARPVRVPAFDVAFEETPRIIELVTTLHRGGAERVVLDLVRELKHLGLGVTLAVLDRASRTTFEAPAGTVFLDARAEGRRQRLDALGELAIASGADILHAHLLNGEDLNVLARSGVPVVTTIHNSHPGWPIKLDALAPGDLALAIACSRDVGTQMREREFPAVTRTIWNGIACNSSSRRARRRLPTEAIRMLVVANHRPQKRLERIPAIVADLRSRGHEARVSIVGEPVKADPSMVVIDGHVREEARRLGVADAVVLEGSRSDVESLYAEHDVVVSTSAFEGLSLVHLESLAAGVPLVTTAVAGTEELSKKHGHAFAVPLDAAPSAFGDAIVAALDPARPCQESLALDFTARKMAERHADLFARVLATSRRHQKRGLVLVANNFSTGGAQSSARRLLVSLASMGVPVRAIVIQEQAAFPTPGRAALASLGIEVLVAPRSGDVDSLVTAHAVARAVDEWSPAAVLFWNVISQHKVLIADLLLDTPIWDVSPGEMYFASFDRYFKNPRIGSPYLTTRDYGRLLAGAIVKYEGERAHAEDVLGVPVEVVPNGVLVPERPPSRPRRDRIIVGTLARLGPDKKLEQLIDAVAHAVNQGRFASCELRIAGAASGGDMAYAAALRERSEGLPIEWVGERESTEFLAELDLFAMVSEPSGCPNASLEAMAAGLAVVATDAGGAREQIVHGETGLLVPRGDAAALGHAIADLARDPLRRAEMGRASHARAQDAFDVRRMASDYARICLGEPHAS